MRSDSQFPVRDAIHAVTGPLGWSLALMAKAAQCSVATVQNDLRERGGVTGTFPNRPTTAGEIYAATFTLWLKDGFLNDIVRGVAEELLEVPRLQATVDGMGRSFGALCEPVILSEDAPYMNLLSAIFGFNLRGRVGVRRPWVMYAEGVKRGEFPAPQSANGVLDAVSQLYRAQIDRSGISLPGMSGVREGVDAALLTLNERSRNVLICLYGLESGVKPRDLQAVARELGVSRELIRQIEAKALRLLRSAEVAPHLQKFEPRTVGDLIANERGLRQEVASLQRRVEGLVLARDELAQAIKSGNPTTILLSQVEANDLENLSKWVTDFEFSVRSQNCLGNAGIERIWQLAEKTESDLLKTKNFGRKSLNEIKGILQSLGLSLGMTIPPLLKAALPGGR